MLEIIICDDHKDIVERLVAFTEVYLMNTDKKDVYIGLATTQPDDVLEYIGLNGTPARSNTKYKLFFLDIDYSNKASYDGITLASTIRQNDPFSDIVFVSSARGLSSDALRHQILPLNYLNKGMNFELLKDEIIQIIDDAYKRMILRSTRDELVPIACGRRTSYIDLSTVLYIKGNKGEKSTECKMPDLEFPDSSRSFLRTVTSDMDLKFSLKYYDENISTLIRLGKSYLINPLNVCEIRFENRKGILTLTNGEEIEAMRTSVVQYQEKVEALRERSRMY